MSAPVQTMQLSSAPGIYWRKVANNTIVVDERNEQSYSLAEIPEVIWTCLTLAYPYPKIICVIAQMRNCSAESAEEEARAIFFEWQSLGLIQITEIAHG